VLETLAGVSHEDAAAHPIEGAHSIWELALHLSSDYRLVLRRLTGDGRQLTKEEGWPAPLEATKEAWAETLEELRRLNQELRSAVRGFPSERLDDPLVSSVPYTAYTQLIGITQHGLYHAGQMAILKRALLRSDRERAISRHWRGVCKRERAEAYVAHLQAETLPALAKIPGFVRASILKREVDRGTEFQIVTVWKSREAIQAFAGPDLEAAVVPAVVRDMMVEFDERVRHYDVC
jgi:heme-degrading monooxygenase HmoA/uncharacterized damage-inducible protein DinB